MSKIEECHLGKYEEMRAFLKLPDARENVIRQIKAAINGVLQGHFLFLHKIAKELKEASDSGIDLSEVKGLMESNHFKNAEMEFFALRPEDYLIYAQSNPHRPHAEIIHAVLEEELEMLKKCKQAYAEARQNAKRAHFAGIQRWEESLKKKREVAKQLGLEVKTDY